MKFEYTPETDTLYIEFKNGKGVEGESINSRTTGFFDSKNELSAIEIEHAKKAVDFKKMEINGKLISSKNLFPNTRRKIAHKKPAR